MNWLRESEDELAATFADWRRLPLGRRNLWFLRLVNLARSECERGEQDPETVAANVLARAKNLNGYKSLIAIIGVAVLSGVVQWIVRRVLDRLYPRE